MHRLIASLAACGTLFVCLSLSGCAGGSSSSSTPTTTTTTPSTPAIVPPAITSIAPAKVDAGASADLSLTVNGTNFLSGSTVQVGVVAVPTTYVSATQLTATVSAAQLASGAMLPIVVLNGNSTSAGSGTAVSLEVDNPTPVITSFTPGNFVAGGGSATVSVTGTGFVRSTAISVNGTSRSTTYVSATQVNTILTAADLASANSLSIAAVNGTPGGGTSAAASLPVNNAVPVLVSLTPATVAIGAKSATVTITGTNFIAGSVALVNASARTTSFISPTQVAVALTAADMAAAGRLSVTVANPAPGGGTSNALPVTVAAPTVTPVLTSLSPASLVAGGSGTSTSASIQVFGTGLTLNCQILWNSTPLSFYLGSTYTYLNNLATVAYYASATVPANLFASTGTAAITANCPTAPTPVSNALTLAITDPPAPTLTSVSPAAGPIGVEQKLNLTGTNFTTKSVVSYNGVALSTAFGSSTSLTAILPATSNALPGIGAVTVNTPAPGGGTSGSMSFTAYVPLVNNDMVYNPVNGLFYASVPSSAGMPYGNSIVSIDPATGTLGSPIQVGSEPGRLALTSDGKFLWVGLNGANALRKVDLVAGTAGLQFSLPQQQSISVGNATAYALAALPGATDSVVVSSGSYSNNLAIYDSGVVRGTPISGFSTQGSALLVDGSRNEIYTSGYSAYQTFNYSSTGITQRASASAGPSVANNGDMQIAGGKLYPSDGRVYDPESAALQATLYSSGSTVANGSTFADLSLNKIFVLGSSGNNYPALTNYQVQVFSATDYTSTATIPMTVATDPYTFGSGNNRLTRWGSNGLAFRGSVGLYSLRSNLVKDLSGTSADMAVAISSSGSTTSAPIAFTATVTNNGGSTATNAVLAAFLPSNGSLRGVTTTAGSCSAVKTLTCNLGSLANGATAKITVNIQPLTAGDLTLGAQVLASENDTVASNNSASSTVSVTGADYNDLPVLTSITPVAIKAGSSDTTLTINGSGFNSSSVVNLGSTALTASLVSSTQMTATVPAASIASMGWSPVTVTNPTPGGGRSAPAPLTVFNVVTAGLNKIVYEPFSRKIFASVGSGSSTLTGNSIAQLTPESGTFNTPANVGSQPTRIAITSSGKYLYSLLNGANTIARFNIATNATEFTFSPKPYASSTISDVTPQPGSDTVLAVGYASYGGVGLVDVDVPNRGATLRGGTTTSNYYAAAAGTTAFLDANNLIVYDGSLKRFTVPAAGFTSSTASASSSVQQFGTFMLSGKYAYADAGGFADVSGSVPVQLGSFRPVGSYTYYDQKVVGDPGLNRVFSATSTTGTSSSMDGVVAFDQSTLVQTLALPLGLPKLEGNASYTVTDIVRWGQDGLALLTSTGHVYLLRGAAVVPGLLNANPAPVLTAASVTALTHGADNTLLTLTGSNFLPGVAVSWNGSYRTTVLLDATHVSVAIPASDLAAAGTGALTAANPGSSASAAINVSVN